MVGFFCLRGSLFRRGQAPALLEDDRTPYLSQRGAKGGFAAKKPLSYKKEVGMNAKKGAVGFPQLRRLSKKSSLVLGFFCCLWYNKAG